MSEYFIGFVACGSLVGLALTSLLYMLGGRKTKAIRRYGASFVISLTIWIASLLLGTFSYFYLLIYPIKIGEYSLGYGGHSMPRPVQRFLITLASCMAGLVFCLKIGGLSWFLLGLQGFVGLGTIMFAFKNPIAPAAEEPLVCCLNNLIVIFYPFIIVNK